MQNGEYYSGIANAQTHLGHGKLALEPPPHPVINTLGLPPCLLHALVPVGLVAPADIDVNTRTAESKLGDTNLKGLVRFLTMVMLAMADYSADKTVSLRTFQGDLG